MRQATYGFVVVGVIIAGIGGITFASVQRTAYQNAALDLAVRVRLQGAVVDLSRNLQEDWDRLTTISLGAATPELVDHGLRSAFALDDMVAWAGVIGNDSDARIVLDGGASELSSRSWFAAARTSPYVGVVDVGADREIALIMARPIAAEPDGGAVAIMMPFSALSNYLNVSAVALGMDLLLVGPGSKRIAASSAFSDDAIGLPSRRSAAAGIATSQQEIWPDGRLYFSAVLPLASSGDLPPMGLSLIGRIDQMEFAAADSTLIRESIRLIAALLGALCVLTFLFVRIFVAPFGVLARNADRIANGADEYPYEGRQTHELALLSAAVARLKASQPESDPR